MKVSKPALVACMSLVPAAWASSLPSERTIGRIEAVFEFRRAMPTGVTVASDGRIFINFPRWGDDVPFTVGEIRDGKLVAYPDAAINKPDAVRAGETLISVQSVVVDARMGRTTGSHPSSV